MMNKKSMAWLLLCVGGLSLYLHANPIHTTHPQLAPVRAQEMVRFSDAKGTRLLFKEHDNTSGLLVRVLEYQGDYAVIVDPLSPHPDHADHMVDPVIPVSGVLRFSTMIEEQEFPLTQAGSSWVAAISGDDISLMPGDAFSLLIWADGDDAEEDDESAFWAFLQPL